MMHRKEETSVTECVFNDMSPEGKNKERDTKHVQIIHEGEAWWLNRAFASPTPFI